jgi:UDP-glucose 4-epimerase
VSWLLTGGAGYIGAHIVQALRASGRDVVVLDDLSTGTRARLPDDVPLVEATIADCEAVGAALREYDIDGVIHLAAKKAAGESVELPLLYYRENLDGTLAILEAMQTAGIDRIVFSSSASVYGTPTTEFVTEDAPTVPESPYGETKLASEWVIRDMGRARGLRQVSLRYFNVAGAGSPELGDTGVNNLIPMVFDALSHDRNPQVFGADYPTRDGSCIRDYISVVDLANAHVAAVAALEGSGCSPVYNVGRGEGFTVKEVMTTVRSVTGIDFTYDVVDRRAGDPAQVVATVDRIRDELGWVAHHNLEDMVRSAWAAWAATHVP